MKQIFTVKLLIIMVACSAQKKQTAIFPGQLWLDDRGFHINAHGGGILVHEGTYYWFGEHKTEGVKGNQAWVGVHCYSSDDLMNWKDEGIALKVSEDPKSPIVQGCIIERPKVIFNKKTQQFVMWFHLEIKGQGYKAARTGLAVAEKPTGPYRFIRDENPNAFQWPVGYDDNLKTIIYQEDLKSWSPEWLEAIKKGLFLKRDFEKGQMSRDMTLFVDDDQTAYHIHASEDNLTIHISELNGEYTGFTGKYIRVLPAGHNEAPAVMKKDGKYFMITSGCTGWKPNAARLLVSGSMMGKWEYVRNPCVGEDAELTFHSQSTFILPLAGRKDAFVFLADRWNPENAIDGRYIWLPVQFDEKGGPYLKWIDRWNPMEYFSPENQ